MGEQKNVTALEAEADDINPFALPQNHCPRQRLRRPRGGTPLSPQMARPLLHPLETMDLLPRHLLPAWDQQ